MEEAIPKAFLIVEVAVFDVGLFQLSQVHDLFMLEIPRVNQEHLVQIVTHLRSVSLDDFHCFWTIYRKPEHLHETLPKGLDYHEVASALAFGSNEQIRPGVYFTIHILELSLFVFPAQQHHNGGVSVPHALFELSLLFLRNAEIVLAWSVYGELHEKVCVAFSGEAQCAILIILVVVAYLNV